MSTGYELTGRTRQKQRTRRALMDAARELLAEGRSPTVEQAADRAGVSRSTAYRYFPNHRLLIRATYPEIEMSSLLDPGAPADPRKRLDLVTEQIALQVLEHERELRAQLRLSLEPADGREDGLPLRKGRAVGWLEDALSPLQDVIPQQELRRLVLAIRTTVGIESLVWLTDVGGVSRPEAAAIMRWSARALLDATLARTEDRGHSRGGG